ncbi:MAG: methyltransferase domain-containing protein [Sphingomicrobium sp.]
MADELFDMELRALRRDRAARMGPVLFLHERAFEDCLERLESMRKDFRSALLIGCPDPDWPNRLRAYAAKVEVVDPGHLFARSTGGQSIVEDAWAPTPAAYDLCLAIGTLDSVNDLPRSLLTLRFALGEGGLLLGALSGGNTLPRLRAAMRAADEVAGTATPHVHPRIDPAALAGLLVSAGFNAPVIDVDRVAVSYPSLDRLVDDLRRMGGTNLLRRRSRAPLNKAEYAAAARTFAEGSADGTEEVFEILHFLGWNSI